MATVYVIFNESARRIENPTTLYPSLSDANAGIARLKKSRVQRTTWDAAKRRDVASQETLTAVAVTI